MFARGLSKDERMQGNSEEREKQMLSRLQWKPR